MSEVWPADRQDATSWESPEERLLAGPPGTYPVPTGRGRWRVSVHNRTYAATFPRDSILSELPDARSRSLNQSFNSSATFNFTLDGHSPSAVFVKELVTEVIAWRWDDRTGVDVAMFRGPITQSQDSISEQTATVSFTCHDYMAMLTRRFNTANVQMGWLATDQDNIAGGLIYYWGGRIIDVNQNPRFQPGAYLPLFAGNVSPDGTPRNTLSGIIRDRMYPGQTLVSEALFNLAACVNGFDFDCKTWGNQKGTDNVRIFYPYQGVTRSDVQLMYGSTVSSLTRNFNSADYANYQRALGNRQNADANAPQLFSERYNPDSWSGSAGVQGLWMSGENASDVSVQRTLDDHAYAALNQSQVVVPHYSAVMRPDAYSFGYPNMGDVVPLVVLEGRLTVNTTVRVLGLSYDIGDDGDEKVSLALGRPDVTLTDLFTLANADVNALARR